MRKVQIGKVRVSGLCIGGNPFSGFSHQNSERSKEMTDYYTPKRIKETLHIAEQAGINTFFGRTDEHILGIVKEYWDEGGTIQWFAQVCTERNDDSAWRKWIKASAKLGASAGYIHGGVVDSWYANKLYDNFNSALDMMREHNLTAGFAGHSPDAHRWINDNLDVDFQMCCHYNPTDRSQNPHHISEGEKWDYNDRMLMLDVTASIKKPVVHYKVFAGGNKPIIEAFEVMGKYMHSSDVACVGFFLKDDPDMIYNDIALFEKYVDGNA